MVTLDLIATNVYNYVKAPFERGFSIIEIWNIGVQVSIFVGIIEYGIILGMKKYHHYNAKQKCEAKKKKSEFNCFIKTVDKWTFIGSILFIIVFNLVYWSVILSASNNTTM